MNNLLISGNTNELTGWDIQSIIPQSKDEMLETILQYENDNTIGKYCDGLTYLEIEVLNNTY